MNLQITIFEKRLFKDVCLRRFAIICLAGFSLFLTTSQAQEISRTARKSVLIRETDAAEGGKPEREPDKEQNPARSKENLDVGNIYFKRRNYSGAISRYLEAITWQENSIPAHEALARAYEKNGEFSKALKTLETVMEKNPDSPKNKVFQEKIAGLKKKLQ
jgi:tetratricopeptide (TPR) repeat protein